MPGFNTIITAVNGVVVCDCGDPKSKSFVEIESQAREMQILCRNSHLGIEDQARQAEVLHDTKFVTITTPMTKVEIDDN